LKNDVHLPVFRIRMFLGLPEPHPDPLVRGTDPRIRIGIRWTRNSAIYSGFHYCPGCVDIRKYDDNPECNEEWSKAKT
jgi:hypothetical protein